MNVFTEQKPPYREHLGAHRQYWRDMILGVNDGLVSIFLLVAGVVGGGMSASNVLLAGIAAAIAGAISMAAGEYMATKSQEEVFQGEIELEREHFLHYRDREIDELYTMFRDFGFDGDLLERVVERFDQDDESLMKIMVALEFGVVDHQRRSPYRAMLMSGGLFLTGALPSVVPFALVSDTGTGLMFAAIGSGAGLFAVGVVKTVATRTRPLISGLENLVVATGGAVLSYGIGWVYQRFF